MIFTIALILVAIFIFFSIDPPSITKDKYDVGDVVVVSAELRVTSQYIEYWSENTVGYYGECVITRVDDSTSETRYWVYDVKTGKYIDQLIKHSEIVGVV